MDKKVEMLHKLCEALTKELEEYSKKIEKADGMSAGDLDAIDKLSHALKSIKTTIAMIEADNGEGGYSGRYMPLRGTSYADGRGGNHGSSNRGSSYAKRDSMGRYSREGGYSYADEFAAALEEAMNAAPNDQMREKLRRMMQEM